MNEYVNRKDLRDALYDADAITMEGVKIINQFPSADVAPVHRGRWVYEWISVKDRVPKNSGHYLVVHRNKHDGSTSTAIAAYIKCKIGEWWANDETYNVTYWMLLPEPPKKEE